MWKEAHFFAFYHLQLAIICFNPQEKYRDVHYTSLSVQSHSMGTFGQSKVQDF